MTWMNVTSKKAPVALGHCSTYTLTWRRVWDAAGYSDQAVECIDGNPPDDHRLMPLFCKRQAKWAESVRQSGQETADKVGRKCQTKRAANVRQSELETSGKVGS